MAEGRLISMEEVAKHCTKDDCWLVLCGNVYDLSEFQATHPGGSRIITDNAGMDATALFLPVHPSDIAERLLSPDVKKGRVDPATVKPEHVVAAPAKEIPGENDGEEIDVIPGIVRRLLSFSSWCLSSLFYF